MEADWEVEIGGDAPVIDACWEGFVDLRHAPDRAAGLSEARDLPALADALARLNGPPSPFWTSKCDVWRPESFDPDELDAPGGAGENAIACYIDLLPRSQRPGHDPGAVIASCVQLCATLRNVPLRGCRADLIVRRAWISPRQEDFGITAYVTACGPAFEDARACLASALAAIVEAVLHPCAAG
jgi:hypothetical protein